MRLFAHFVGIILAVSGVSQTLCQEMTSKDPLKEAQARLVVSQSRAESKFRDQMREFDELNRRDPEKARLALDLAEKIVTDEQAFSEKRRSVLLDQIAKKRNILLTKNLADREDGASTLSKSKATKPVLTETEKQQVETSRQLREINRLGESGEIE